MPQMSQRESRPFRAVFARHWRAYEARFGAKIPRMHRRAAQAILHCRTPAMGGHLYACEHCGDRHYRYHSCNHRSCPNCGQRDAADWAKRQRAKLFPVAHRMVTFTVPAELRRVFRSNQRVCFDAFFRACAETLQAVAGEPKYLGGRLGLLGVLHTWTRQLEYHPHIHFLVTQGGLSAEGTWRRPRYASYFLPFKRLSIDLRIRMERVFREQHPEIHAAVPRSVWRAAWVCHIGEPGNGSHAIDYLSRYVTQTALSKKRILDDDGKQVTIRYTESATGQSRQLRLDGYEFIRRLLQHVLPKGFKRIRAYGLYAPAAKKKYLAVCALLAHWPPERPAKPRTEPPECPRCRLDMVRIGKLARGPPAGPPARNRGGTS